MCLFRKLKGALEKMTKALLPRKRKSLLGQADFTKMSKQRLSLPPDQTLLSITEFKRNSGVTKNGSKSGQTKR